MNANWRLYKNCLASEGESNFLFMNYRNLFLHFHLHFAYGVMPSFHWTEITFKMLNTKYLVLWNTQYNVKTKLGHSNAIQN